MATDETMRTLWTDSPTYKEIRRSNWLRAMREMQDSIRTEVAERNRRWEQTLVAQGQGMMHDVSAQNEAERLAQHHREYAQQVVAQQERQRQWDAQAEQGQYWQKAQQTALANLSKTGELMNMDETARQRRIAEETYKTASLDFQKAGDFESAKEAERRMRLAQGQMFSPVEQATEEDYATGVVRQVAPTAEQVAALQPQEGKLQDFFDAMKVAFVSTSKSLAQSPATVAGTYLAGDRSVGTTAGIAAGTYAEGYRRGETQQQTMERIGALSPEQTRMLDSLGRYGEKIQQDYDEWYQSHPELWERPEYRKGPIEAWRTDKKVFFDPFYWGTQSVGSSIYTAGALLAGAAGWLATGGNPAGMALGAFAYTYPVLTQYAYDTAMESGADRATALEIAGVVGPATAILETSTDVFMLWSIAGLRQAFTKKVTEEVAKDITKRAVKQGVGKVGLKRVLEIEGLEILTENLQDITTNAAIKTFNENKKVFEGLGDTTLLTAAATLPFALLGGGGAAVSTQNQNKIAEFQIRIQQFIEEEELAKARAADAAAEGARGFDITDVINETAEFAERTARELGLEVDVEAARQEAIEATKQEAPQVTPQEAQVTQQVAPTEQATAQETEQVRTPEPTQATEKQPWEMTADEWFAVPRALPAGYRSFADMTSRFPYAGEDIRTQFRPITTKDKSGQRGIKFINEIDDARAKFIDTVESTLERNDWRTTGQALGTGTNAWTAFEAYLDSLEAFGKATGMESWASAAQREANELFERLTTEAVSGNLVAPNNHRYFVLRALRRNKPVPAEVLKDYPDLAAKYLSPTQATEQARSVEKQATEGTVAAQVSQAGTNIAGGVAYTQDEVVRRLLTPPSIEAQAARIFGNKAEQRIVSAVSKIPGGKTALKFVSKTAQAIQTQSGQAAQELAAATADLGARIGPNAASAMMNVLRSYFPESDAVKHLGISADEANFGDATKVRPKREGLSRKIWDIMEHPEDYELDEPTTKMLGMWHRINDITLAVLRQEGIDLDESWFVENYFPRMVQQVNGYEFARPHVDFTKPRLYGTALEAIGKEVRYSIDPIDTIGSYIQEVFLVVASHRMSEGVKQMGETPSQRVPLSVRMRRANAVMDVRRASRAESAIQRARRGEAVPSATIASVRMVSPEIADGITALISLDASQRRAEGAALVLRARELLSQKKKVAATARAEYKRELAIAKAGTPWTKESGEMYRGHFVSPEAKAVLQSWEGTRAHKALEGAATVNDVLRTMVASMDWSSLLIQNLLLIGRPKTFAKVAFRSIEVFFHKSSQAKYMGRDDVVALLQRNPSIRIGFQFEYMKGVSSIEKIPKVGQYLAKPLKPFERFFGFSGDMARIEVAKVLEPMFVQAGMQDQVGTYVNRMTGVMNTEALGISAQQRAIERLLLFAPQYTRACLAYIGYVGQNNVMGREALASFGRLAAAGTAFYVASCMALGQEPQLDPSKPTFYTIKVGNRYLGIGGFQYSFLRFMADSLQSIAGTNGNSPLDFKKFSRKDNPILKWLYSRSAPSVGLTIEGLTERDYLGYPLEDFETWMHWLVVEHMLPISMQEQIPSRTQEAPSNRAVVGVAEFLGLRTFEVEPFYELANEYADKHYQKEWNDLWKPTKSGSYVQSDEQKRLLAMYPDLKEAYDKWKPMQTKKWQADHGLLPNDDAINDAYARELTGKPWDKLSRDEKSRVKEYREFMEEAEEYMSSGSSTGVSPPPLG